MRSNISINTNNNYRYQSKNDRYSKSDNNFLDDYDNNNNNNNSNNDNSNIHFKRNMKIGIGNNHLSNILNINSFNYDKKERSVYHANNYNKKKNNNDNNNNNSNDHNYNQINRMKLKNIENQINITTDNGENRIVEEHINKKIKLNHEEGLPAPQSNSFSSTRFFTNLENFTRHSIKNAMKTLKNVIFEPDALEEHS